MAIRTANKLSPPHAWRANDADGIAKRRGRAQAERFAITDWAPAHPILPNAARVPGGKPRLAKAMADHLEPFIKSCI